MVRKYGRADYLTLCEVQVYGMKRSPHQKRKRMIKRMAKRRHRHVKRRRKHKGVVRRTCSCTNDIHCRPFRGNFFDIHHARAFQMAKIGKEEVQMGLYHCRPAQRWSGGLKIACMKGMAVKKSNGRTVQAYVRRRLDYRGKKLQARLTAGGAYVTLRNAAHVEQTNGVCGGKSMYKSLGKKGNWRINGRVVKKNGLFACNDCKLGVGVWGAQCDCKQYMLSSARQFFSRKFAGPKSKKVKKFRKSKLVIRKQKIRHLTSQCVRAFYRTPIGKLTMRHKTLRLTISRFARGCALDRLAGFKPKKTGNRNRMVANVCRAARAMANGKKPKKMLCRIVAKCGLKSKKCDVSKPKRTIKYTRSAGGRGGRPVHSYCRKGRYINFWKVRSGRFVNNLQGRCSDGKWLRKCGGRGGRLHHTRRSSQRIVVRTGAWMDKFSIFGGNGGGRHVLNCGRGWQISGYRMRCGALVDRIQFQCRFGKAWRGMRIKKRKIRKPPKKKVFRARKLGGPRRRRKVRRAKKPKVLADEKQMEKKGGMRRNRNRKGAGRANVKGCKVTERWANAHLKWCAWSSWGPWRGR